MKNRLLCAFLCLGLLTAYYSCEKENVNEDMVTQGESFEINYVGWDHLILENITLANKVTEINKKALSQRDVTSTTYGFTIDETEV